MSVCEGSLSRNESGEEKARRSPFMSKSVFRYSRDQGGDGEHTANICFDLVKHDRWESRNACPLALAELPTTVKCGENRPRESFKKEALIYTCVDDNYCLRIRCENQERSNPRGFGVGPD